MTAVVVFTRAGDPYSVRAKALLRMKGIPFTEKMLPAAHDEMLALTGTDRTPQIIIDGKHIGSFDALGSMDLHGKLDYLRRV